MAKQSMESTVSIPEEALRKMAETEGPSPKKTTIIGGEIKPPKMEDTYLGPATDPRAGKQRVK